jgi:hypothetical protein
MKIDDPDLLPKEKNPCDRRIVGCLSGLTARMQFQGRRLMFEGNRKIVFE